MSLCPSIIKGTSKACIFLGEAPRRPQQQEIPPTPILTDENPIAMPSVCNDLLERDCF